jgi:putative toxin-antitoxin system antitoxin component (TIGR02293 family)
MNKKVTAVKRRGKLKVWTGEVLSAPVQEAPVQRARAHAITAAEILVRATEVLEDRALAEGWLASPVKALGGAVPLEHAKTEEGLRQVLDVLGRIEQGVFS